MSSRWMDGSDGAPPGWTPTSLDHFRARMHAFADERDWHQYHTPRNLVLALVGEVGELSELFQWRGEVAPGLPEFSSDERQHVGEELADVLLYLVRLADRCGVDLAAAAEAKMEKNAAKYPAERCKGSSAKYSAYTSTSAGPGEVGEGDAAGTGAGGGAS